LTKKDSKFNWNTEQQNVFDSLKEKLTSAPVLSYPDFTRQFLIITDASDYAIGAVLSQGPIGQDRPIAYASRILNKAEQNYNTTEKELLAIVGGKTFPTLCLWNKVSNNNRSQTFNLALQCKRSRIEIDKVATQIRRV